MKTVETCERHRRRKAEMKWHVEGEVVDVEGCVRAYNAQGAVE